jgi:hypothetical protein
MKPDSILFSTGKLIITENNISFHQSNINTNHVNTIGRENIGHTDSQFMRLLPKVDMVYCFQILVIGFIISILGVLIGLKLDFYMILYGGVLIFLFGAFLLFAVLWFDGLLGLNVAKPILLSIFGVDAIRVIVQNIYGGNNLQFFILPNEKSKLPKFEDYKLDKTYSIKNVNEHQSNKQNIDDIEKLAALRDKGILTQEEFDLKKKQILGL